MRNARTFAAVRAGLFFGGQIVKMDLNDNNRDQGMARTSAALLSMLMLAGCSEEPGEAKAPKLELRPEMVVVSSQPGWFACQTEDLLTEFISHAVAGEKTKGQGMLDSADCLPFPAGQTYKILAVHGSVSEFTNVKNTSATVGLWAPNEAFAPAAK